MAYIRLQGEVGYEITLYSVVSAVQDLRNKLKTIESLQIDLTSEGGDSVVGRQIHDYIKNLEFPVHINVVDYAYSAGFTILMAGGRRTAQNQSTEFLMHSPVYAAFFELLSETDAQAIKDLIEDEKKTLAGIYSEAINVDKDTIITLMDSNQIIDTETAIKLGMISEVLIDEKPKIEIDYQLAAKWYVGKKHELLIKNHKEMNTQEFETLNTKIDEQKGFFSQLFDGIKKMISGLKNLTITSDEGEVIEIIEETLEVGVTVTSGQEGVFVVDYNNKKWTVTIAGGIVTEIVEIVEEPPVDETPEQMQAKIDALTSEVEELKSQLQNKADIEKKLADNEAYIANVRKLTSKYEQPDGTFDFSGVGKTEEKTEDGKTIACGVRAKRTQK